MRVQAAGPSWEPCGTPDEVRRGAETETAGRNNNEALALVGVLSSPLRSD